MKKKSILAVIAALALLTLMLTACGKASFELTENTGKRMVITAEKADKDASFITGSLEVAEGEQIVITSNLTKGEVRVEIIAAEEDQSMDELPELDGEAILKANVSSKDSATGTVSAGSYLLRATCLNTATGTIQIEVKPAA